MYIPFIVLFYSYWYIDEIERMSRLANSHPFRVRLTQLPHQNRSIWVRNAWDFSPIFTSIIYVIIEPEIAPYTISHNCPTLRLAGLYSPQEPMYNTHCNSLAVRHHIGTMLWEVTQQLWDTATRHLTLRHVADRALRLPHCLVALATQLLYSCA